MLPLLFFWERKEQGNEGIVLIPLILFSVEGKRRGVLLFLIFGGYLQKFKLKSKAIEPVCLMRGFLTKKSDFYKNVSFKR